MGVPMDVYEKSHDASCEATVDEDVETSLRGGESDKMTLETEGRTLSFGLLLRANTERLRCRAQLYDFLCFPFDRGWARERPHPPTRAHPSSLVGFGTDHMFWRPSFVLQGILLLCFPPQTFPRISTYCGVLRVAPLSIRTVTAARADVTAQAACQYIASFLGCVSLCASAIRIFGVSRGSCECRLPIRPGQPEHLAEIDRRNIFTVPIYSQSPAKNAGRHAAPPPSGRAQRPRGVSIQVLRMAPSSSHHSPSPSWRALFQILFLLPCLAPLASAQGGDLIAALDYGTFQGAYSPAYNLSYWQKIPFAQPPVGALRFRGPQPPLPLDPPNATATTVYNSTQTFDVCPQKTTSGSEDCLYLGLFARPWAAGAALRPVLVVFYGGAYIQGGASFSVPPAGFPVLNVSAAADVVMVYANYRTNAFGFLPGREVAADREGSDLNPGLLDQDAAIRCQCASSSSSSSFHARCVGGSRF